MSNYSRTKKSLRQRLAASVCALSLATGFGVVTTLAAPSSAHAEQGKVALVDVQRVLMETKQGKKARKDLESSSKKKQQKLDKKRTQLESDQAKLQSLSGEQLAQAQQKLERELMEWQSMYMALQQELAQQENRLLEKIYKNCAGLTADIAKKRGFDLVLVRDPMTVIYAQDGYDLTQDVIKAYDKKFPS